jgi:formate hydrogenlyase subunit 3/multisubunit Na+/H+ antiporter MnhD subunit
MIKAGLIGWLRLVPSETSTMFLGWGELCLVLGLAAAFYGVAIGLTQNNAKTVLAYSSISQMGLMTVGVGLAISGPDSPHAALTATLVYAMHHGFAKGALFLGVGVASTACGTFWRRCLCGLGLLLPALTLAGMPLTSGALAKVMLKSSASTAPENWPSTLALLLPLAAVGTTLLMARFLWIAWPNRDSRTQARGLSVWLSWTVLLLAVALGVLLWPWGDSVSLGKSLLSPAKMFAAMWPPQDIGSPSLSYQQAMFSKSQPGALLSWFVDVEHLLPRLTSSLPVDLSFQAKLQWERPFRQYLQRIWRQE